MKPRTVFPEEYGGGWEGQRYPPRRALTSCKITVRAILTVSILWIFRKQRVSRWFMASRSRSLAEFFVTCQTRLRRSMADD